MDESPPNPKQTRSIQRVVILVLIVACIVTFWPLLDHLLTRSSRDVVQHAFDHPAILTAARKMMDDVPNTQFGWSSNPENPIDDPRIPQVIRDLNPRHVNVAEDYVQIEFAGGFEHYGLFAYREGTPEQFGKRLIDGLTYYSD